MDDTFTCKYDFKTRNIGSGTYGEVSIVERDGFKYAFKKIKIDNQLKKSYFFNPLELDIIFRLQSPYLVRGEEITVPKECTPNEVGVVTEYIDGNLGKDIAKMPYVHRKKIMIDIARGLKCLHDNNYLHLDIKIDNCMYHKEIQPRGVLLDYGLGSYAPFGVENGVFSSQGRLTFEYNSPQSAPKADGYYYYTDKHDIWALGITFLEFICDGNFNYITTDIYNDKDKEGDDKALKVLSKYQTYYFSEKRIDDLLNDFVFKYTTIEIDDKDLLVDLIKNMLKVNENMRYNIDQVINHPYFAKYKITQNDDKYCFTKQPKIYEPIDMEKYHNYLNGVNEIVRICKTEIGYETSYILFMAVDIYMRFLLNVQKYGDKKDEIISSIENLPKMCILIANKYFHWSEYNYDEYVMEIEDHIAEENLIYKIIDGRIRDERYFLNCNNVAEVRFVYDYFIKPKGNSHNPNLIKYLSYNGKEFMDTHRKPNNKNVDVYLLEIKNL